MNDWESRSPHVGESLIRVEFYLWNPEQNSRNPQPPLRTTGIPVIGIRNPRCGIQDLRLSWISLHGAIHN